MKTTDWNILKNPPSLSELKEIHKQPLNISEAEWYQCDVIRKDNRRDFLYRFLADSEERAKIKVFFYTKVSLTGSIKNYCCYLIYKYFVRTFDIYKVYKSVLDNYDFNAAGETGRFYDRIKG